MVVGLGVPIFRVLTGKYFFFFVKMENRLLIDTDSWMDTLNLFMKIIL